MTMSQEETALATAEQQQWVFSNVMPVVRDYLQRLKEGDLTEEYNIDRTCYEKLVSELTSDERSMSDSFLKVVADVLAKQLSQSAPKEKKEKLKKKCRKKMTELLNLERDAVMEEIRKEVAFDDISPKDDQSSRLESGDRGSDEDAASNADDSMTGYHGENGSSSKRSAKPPKKSRKKKAKDKKKKKKRKKRTKKDYDVDDDSSEGDKQFPTIQDSQSQKKAEEEFTRRKHEDLSKIPTETSERFLGLGFSKWNKSVLPIIELGPYHVPPGDIRDQWFTMFENCQKSQRPLSRLIYWYGTENLEESYSFTTAKSIISYEVGLEKNHDKLPANIKKKVERGAKLTKMDRQTKTGLELIAEEADREPNERLRWLSGWKEEYMLEFRDGDEDIDEDSVEEEQTEKTAKQLKEKQSKKEKKEKKSNGSQEGNEAEKADLELTPTKKAPPISEPMDFEVDIPSDDAADQDFFSAEATSSSDENDESYIDPNIGVKKKRKQKSEAGAQSKSKPKKAPRALSKKAAEQKRFEECEELFLPIMSALKNAISKNDMIIAEKCVKRFQNDVELTTPSFIIFYKFGLCVKDARKHFKTNGMDELVQLCHNLTKDLKRIYAEKKKDLPDGFKPKIGTKKESIAKKAKKVLSTKRKRPREDDLNSEDEGRQERSGKRRGTAQESHGSGSSKADDKVVVDISRKPDEPAEETMAQPSKAAAPKKFSLKGMFERPAKKALIAAAPEMDTSGRAGSSAIRLSTKRMPHWLSGPPPEGLVTPSEEERALAIEFIEESFSILPAETVDAAFASLSLEAAIKEWSVARGDDSEVYWVKIHDIVAAIVGASESVGTPLAKEIIAGKYTTPKDLLRITRTKLNSFVGDYAA